MCYNWRLVSVAAQFHIAEFAQVYILLKCRFILSRICVADLNSDADKVQFPLFLGEILLGIIVKGQVEYETFVLQSFGWLVLDNAVSVERRMMDENNVNNLVRCD